MPSWVLFSLLSTAIWTIVGFIDKYNLDQQIKDYRGMAMYSAIVCFFIGSILWVLTGFPLLSLRDGALVILTGILAVFGSAIYFYVMQRELASNVFFLLQLIPVFVLILAFSFLHESILLHQLLGFVLILIPTLLVASGSGGKLSIRPNKNTILLFLVDFLWAASSIIFKFVVETGSFSKMVSYES